MGDGVAPAAGRSRGRRGRPLDIGATARTANLSTRLPKQEMQCKFGAYLSILAAAEAFVIEVSTRLLTLLATLAKLG